VAVNASGVVELQKEAELGRNYRRENSPENTKTKKKSGKDIAFPL
jgi:hypothetical protein